MIFRRRCTEEDDIFAPAEIQHSRNGAGTWLESLVAVLHAARGELLEAGADPDARNKDNDTPLHYLAAGWGPTPGAGVEGLAAHAAIAGAAATGTRRAQATGLIAGLIALAGTAHNRKKVGWTVRHLVNAGVDFDLRNDAGETPAELATRLGNTRQARYMDRKLPATP